MMAQNQPLSELGKHFDQCAETVWNYEAKQGLIFPNKPKNIPSELQTVRHTVGIVLIDDTDTEPRFAFKRQTKIPKKPADYYRWEIFGGGVPSVQQHQTQDIQKHDDLLSDPALLNSDGSIPQNFDFRYYTKSLLRDGRFRNLHYKNNGRTLQESLQGGAMERLMREIDTSFDTIADCVDVPRLLDINPRDSHLQSMGFDDKDLLREIADKWKDRRNLCINDQGKLSGITLTIREWFAYAFADIDALLQRTKGHMNVMTIDELMQRANESHADVPVALSDLEREEPTATYHLDAWKNRPEGSLRNSSLLAGVAGALKQIDLSWSARVRRGLHRIKRRLIGPRFAA